MAWTRLFIILISMATFVGCTTMNFQVDSQPNGAEVFSQKGKSLKKLGVTPLSLSANQVDGDNIHLVIKKEGFQQYSVVLEKRTLSTNMQIFAQLNKGGESRGLASVEGGRMGKVVEKVSRTVASIQAHLIKHNYQTAENIAQTLVNEYPYFGVGWNLLGNAYFLQNRHHDALDAYYKAVEYDPDNQETHNLIQRIENKPSRSER